jgi:hypothetical protein
MNACRILLVLLSLVSIHGVWAQGKVVGRVTDNQGSPIYAVIAVVVENNQMNASTDFEGIFQLRIEDSKLYTMRLERVGYKTVIDTIQLSDGMVLNREYTLLSDQEMEGVTLTAKQNKGQDSYMDKMKINLPVSIDYISSESIRRIGDPNVVNAVARVSGVSTNGGMVTVRGIGDRYVRTTLNGSKIPTLDPLTNNIRLDIFPSSLVDNIIITKTASPEYFADWAGAYISVETKDYPDKLVVNVESQFGYNPQVTFQDMITSARSKTDWLGFDTGLRSRVGSDIQSPNLDPGYYAQFAALGLSEYYGEMGIYGWSDGDPASNQFIRLGLVQLGILPQAMIHDDAAYQQALETYNTTYKPQAFRLINPSNTDFNNGFSNKWNTTFRKAPIAFSQNVGVGNTVHLFGKELGFFAGFRYGNSYRYDPNGISQRVLQEELNYQIDVQDSAKISRETNSWSGLLNLAYKLNSNNRLSFLFMPNFIGVNDVASYKTIPFTVDQTLDVRKNLFYEQRRQLIYQLATSHYLPGSKIKLNFNSSYTDGYSAAPDFMTTEYKIDFNGDSVVGYQYYPTAGDGIRRFYRYLDENLLEIRMGAEIPLAKGELAERRKLKFGLATQQQFRKIDNEEYRVMLGNGFVNPIQSEDIDAYMSNEHFILTDSLIDFYYVNNDYERNHSFGYAKIHAGYVMSDWEFNPKLKFSGGLRMEQTDMFTDCDKFYRLGYVRDDPRRANLPNFPNVNAAILKQLDFLPSASLIYKIEKKNWGRTNVRMNYSRSIARPSIRELYDAAIVDNEFRTFIYGNSDLKIAYINNFDLRLESYFESGDNITLSGFYKKFTNHIEMGFGNVGITWENIQNSYVVGCEFEGKKEITDQLEFRANVTLIKSQSEFIRRDFQLIEGRKYYEPIDTLYRPMYGQAPYLVNAMLSYSSDTLGLTATISYNVQGPRLVITGTVKGMPDVYEIQRHLLDFKVSKKIGERFMVSVTARDMLNTPVRRAYKLPSGWFDYDRFQYGTSYFMTFTYRL